MGPCLGILGPKVGPMFRDFVKNRPIWAAHPRIAFLWEYPPGILGADLPFMSKWVTQVFFSSSAKGRTIFPPHPSTIDVVVDSLSKKQKPARYKLPSSGNLFLVRVVIHNEIERK